MTVSYEELSPGSRLWIYQSPRALTESEQKEITETLKSFTDQWQAHGKDVYSCGLVKDDHFIMLFADEEKSGVTGCSIDSSVALMRQIASHYQIDLFDRMQFFVKDGDSTKRFDQLTFSQAYQDGELSSESLVYDNLITDKVSLEARWINPIKDSWHARLV